MQKTVPKQKEIVEPIQKGKATIMLRFNNVTWAELVKMVKYLQGNPEGHVIEVYIDNQVFDA